MPENQQQSPQQMPQFEHYRRRKQKKNNWWIPVVIVLSVFALLVILVVGFFTLIGSTIGSAFDKEPVVVRNNSILHLNMANVQEYTRATGFSSFFSDEKPASLRDIINALKAAKTDDRIKGIYYEPSMVGSGFTKRMEVLDAMEDFKTSGKFIYAFIEVGDENAYINALPADSIFMPAEGMMEMNGYGVSPLFFKGLAEKVGVDFYVQQFEDFKSAGEMFSRKSFSDSARLQTQVLLNHRYKTLLNLIEKYRGIDKETANAIFNKGLFHSDEILESGLIDAIAPEYKIKEMMKRLVKDEEDSENGNSKVRLLSVSKYINSNPEIDAPIAATDKKIAIVYGVGEITSGESNDNPFSNSSGIKSGTFISNLRKAAKDKNVGAIIVRIDSPGGSVIASDEIWEELERTKEEHPDVPIYASMADVAASGGFYMAVGCDSIIAHPTTITGSIGVILSIPNLSGVMNKLGVSTDTLSTTDAAQFLNTSIPFSKKDKDKLYSLSQKIYFRFLGKVAEHRGMPVDELRQYAKGRVWTGEDAYKLGLIDKLGGLEDVIDMAKARLGVSKDELVSIVEYPKTTDEIEELLEKLTGGSKDEELEATIAQTAAKYLPYASGEASLILKAMPESVRKQLFYNIELLEMAQRERVLVAMPNLLEIK